MLSTINERKAKAIEYLKQLNIYEDYIEGFDKESKVCFYEGYGGFWVEQEPEVYAKMKEIERKNNCTVYAITHERTAFGECYSFLIVTQHKDEWEDLLDEYGEHSYYAFAYVWDKDDDDCSEFGTVVVQSFGGGITRVG